MIRTKTCSVGKLIRRGKCYLPNSDTNILAKGDGFAI